MPSYHNWIVSPGLHTPFHGLYRVQCWRCGFVALELISHVKQTSFNSTWRTSAYLNAIWKELSERDLACGALTGAPTEISSSSSTTDSASPSSESKVVPLSTAKPSKRWKPTI